MKHPVTLGIAFLAAVPAAPALAGELDQTLADILDKTAPDQIVSTLVYLDEQSDLPGLRQVLDAGAARLATRHLNVVLDLKKAALTQAATVEHLAALKAAGRIAGFEPFWVTNAIRVDATPAEIAGLAERPDVQRVYFNFPIEGIAPVAAGGDGDEAGGGVAGGPEPGLVAIRAPEVWDLGITGEGVLIASLDTGVDGDHPALASRWRGLDPAYAANPGWAFFDPVTGWTFPQADGSHGTHTMGTMCGGAPGDQVGVAPGAEWIHAAVIDRVSVGQTVSDAILAFQWMLDPDGNPFTDFDVPDVCSNSWGVADFHGYPDCDELFWGFLDAMETAGIVVVFAAGNEGFDGLRRPADRATDEFRTFAVAAVNGNSGGFPIAGFSSRGPTFCTPGGQAATKPDIAAPGVDVRSAVDGGGYSPLSGTSMASPHLGGVVALMRQANPDISVEQIKQIIYDNAMDLGEEGDDNDYGHGMVDAFDAVVEALSTVSLTITFPEGRPDFVDPLGGTVVKVVAAGQQAQPEPGTGRLYYGTGGPFTEIDMIETAPGEYDAVFPAFECGAQVDYYVSVEADSGDVIFNPFTAPDSTYFAQAYSGLVVAFADDFETDQGWTVSTNASDGGWDRGVPAGGGDRGDPAIDSDGSGQCYLTDNVDGNSDVDEGSTTLTSPVMDATQIEDPVIRYHRWFSNDFGDGPYTDAFLVEVSDDGGDTWTVLETVGPEKGPEVQGNWFQKEFVIGDFVAVTNQFRIRFTASDTDPQSVVEAGVDAVEISRLVCDDVIVDCPADFDGNDEVDVDDLVALVLAWGPCPGCPADLNDDGEVDVDDLVALVLAWGPCS